MAGLDVDYEVLGVIGKGTFGRAIKVRDRLDGQLYVAKEIRMAGLPRNDKAKCLREADLLSRTEYADGGDLMQLLNQQKHLGLPLSEREVFLFFSQTVKAIAHLHFHKILHRDLKPGNVFLMATMDVKVGDLGLARTLACSQDLANTVCGTPEYFAPELVRGQPYDGKTDLWALGCVLYEMLELQRPFKAHHLPQLFHRILHARPPPISSSFHVAWGHLLERLLSVEPSSRPSAAELEECLPEFERAVFEGGAIPRAVVDVSLVVSTPCPPAAAEQRIEHARVAPPPADPVVDVSAAGVFLPPLEAFPKQRSPPYENRRADWERNMEQALGCGGLSAPGIGDASPRGGATTPIGRDAMGLGEDDVARLLGGLALGM